MTISLGPPCPHHHDGRGHCQKMVFSTTHTHTIFKNLIQEDVLRGAPAVQGRPWAGRAMSPLSAAIPHGGQAQLV